MFDAKKTLPAASLFEKLYKWCIKCFTVTTLTPESTAASVHLLHALLKQKLSYHAMNVLTYYSKKQEGLVRSKVLIESQGCISIIIFNTLSTKHYCGLHKFRIIKSYRIYHSEQMENVATSSLHTTDV